MKEDETTRLSYEVTTVESFFYEFTRNKIKLPVSPRDKGFFFTLRYWMTNFNSPVHVSSLVWRCRVCSDVFFSSRHQVIIYSGWVNIQLSLALFFTPFLAYTHTPAIGFFFSLPLLCELLRAFSASTSSIYLCSWPSFLRPLFLSVCSLMFFFVCDSVCLVDCASRVNSWHFFPVSLFLQMKSLVEKLSHSFFHYFSYLCSDIDLLGPRW